MDPYRTLEPLQVGRQHRIGDTLQTPDAAQHLRIVRHLRHPLRTDEAGRLNRAEAARGQSIDQLDFDGGRQQFGLVLETVTGPDLDDAHIGRPKGGGCVGNSSARMTELQRV